MIRSELTIDAPVSSVWALTIDVERWPELTPTIRRVQRLDGDPLGVGSGARVEQPGQRPAIWTVTQFEREQTFVWETRVATITMVGGHHLEPNGQGCRNVLTLDLSGFGSKMLERLLGRRLRAAIATENAGFKRAAEATSTTDS